MRASPSEFEEPVRPAVEFEGAEATVRTTTTDGSLESPDHITNGRGRWEWRADAGDAEVVAEVAEGEGRPYAKATTMISDLGEVLSVNDGEDDQSDLAENLDPGEVLALEEVGVCGL